MSRVGKNPVVDPDRRHHRPPGQHVDAKGKLGDAVAHRRTDEVEPRRGRQRSRLAPRNESRARAHACGARRAPWCNNMVPGVSTGFTISLEINGVGYRAAVQGKILKLQLGYSHDIEFPIPTGITINARSRPRSRSRGADRQRVGQVAAEIRSLRPPEPYKGKGIKYSTETVRRKEGKKK